MSDDIRSDEITRLLKEMQQGDTEAANQLIPLVYQQLRRKAKALLRRERDGHTLQPTALVNDALMRLIGANSLDWHCRAQFFAVSAAVMRRILIDHARVHRTAKRGGDLRRLSLDDRLTYDWRQAESLLDLDEALNRLQDVDPRLTRVIEMKFFVGMSEHEIADVMNLSVRTVKRDWHFARDWLYREMTRS
jgi:RNA polymerase sigma-70 factor (ECF subfamily)